MHPFSTVVFSNAVVAASVAIGAGLLGYAWNNPAALHVVWLVVLLKLFTPPIVILHSPLLAGLSPSAGEAVANERAARANVSDRSKPLSAVSRPNIASAPAALISTQRPLMRNAPQEVHAFQFPPLSTILAAIWIAGSAIVALRHIVQLRRFAAIVRACERPSNELVALVAQTARNLGLKTVPAAIVTSEPLPPLVWFNGRAPRLILPAALFVRLDPRSQAALVSHELVHIARRDHLVRLVELAATTVFWWHPAVWWSCQRLRDLEEECCDSRVLELASGCSRDYALALVETAKYCAAQPGALMPVSAAVRPACRLSTRIQMLSQSRPNRLNLATAVLIVAVAAVPMSVAIAAQPAQKSATATPIDARPAVLQGQIRSVDGTPLAGARVRIAIPDLDMRDIDTEADGKHLETKTESDGEYRIEIKGLAGPTRISVDASKPGFQRLSGPPRSMRPVTVFSVSPGTTAVAALRLKPALYFAGVVVDDLGKPIPGVEISCMANTSTSSGGMEDTTSNRDGSFEIFNYPAARPTSSYRIHNEPADGTVTFFHPNYIGYEIKDVYLLPVKERASIRIVLRTGHQISGIVRDKEGKPVPTAMIKATFSNDLHRKAVMTDAKGGFTLRGLPSAPATLSVLDTTIHQKVSLSLKVDRDMDDLTVRLKPMQLPANIKSYDVLGIRLADATPQLAAVYDETTPGALILDPGKNSDRFGIGRFAEGDIFFMAGERQASSVREFVRQILAEWARRQQTTSVRDLAQQILADRVPNRRVRVVYTFTNLDMDGTNTQHMKLTPDDIKQLQKLSESFDAKPQ